MTGDDDGRGFAFDYQPGAIHCRRGCVADLGAILDERELDRALLVTGRTVGSTSAVMDPVRDGLGDRLAATFAETTPAKYLSTALDAAERADEVDADVLVAVGSGSSLDTAKAVSTLRSHDESPAYVARTAVDEGALSVVEEGTPTPIVVVPTTLAGADLSVIAGVKLTLTPGDAPDTDHLNAALLDRRLMPTALCYDSALFRTTPESVLTASAMNGFDKAVEMLYSRFATPITDATGVRAVRLLRSGLPALNDDRMDESAVQDVLSGIVAAQYGISTPGSYRASILHSFGHGVAHDFEVHQGVAHGIVAPHVLRYVFEHGEWRPGLFAEAFALPEESPDAVAEGVVTAVSDLRDALGLPDRLRAVDGLTRADLDHVAEEIAGDYLVDSAPVGVDPSVTEIRTILDAAW